MEQTCFRKGFGLKTRVGSVVDAEYLPSGSVLDP